jgi:hypothetical protein
LTWKAKSECCSETFRGVGSLLILVVSAVFASAQDLAPRAYVITPIHSNAVVVSYSYFDGNLIFDNSTPITGATARISVPIFSVYHSFNLVGRTASFTASLPYGVGNVRGTVMDTETKAYRSGLFDTTFRFSVNLMGGAAMDVQDFRKWRQKTIIGASLRLVTPTGQYDPTKLINYGANRWGFKPEVGVSRRWGHWVLDGYAAVWFFTTNHEFFSHNQFSPGTNVQKQQSMGAFEGHLSYDVKPRLWASFDGNFWVGGRTTLNGVENPNSLQKNSRIGGTVSTPVSKHQSLKFSYNRGAYIRYGGNLNNLAVGWQYSWFGRPN